MEDLNLNDNMTDELQVDSKIELDKHIDNIQHKFDIISEGINNLHTQLLDVIEDIRKIKKFQS